MSRHLNSLHYLSLFLVMFTVAATAEAGMWDEPKNLKVLPEDISPDELRETMRGFATNTGSRCSHCHVGENEADLSTYDFSLDDKEKKKKARAMIRMVNDINSYLEESLGKPAAELVAVNCATCHRGQSKPEMIQDVLARSYDEGGIESAADKYRALRERYYGGYTFDFSEKALNILGERMANQEDLDGALAFLDLNLEYYPDSARTLVLKAQVLAAKGDKPAARENYLKAIELEPDNMWTKRLLEQLDAS